MEASHTHFEPRSLVHKDVSDEMIQYHFIVPEIFIHYKPSAEGLRNRTNTIVLTDGVLKGIRYFTGTASFTW